MDRLILHSITVENFGSWRHRTTVEFNGAGPVAVTGVNGGGKSTLCSKALCWGLYGKGSPERMGSGTRTLSGKDLVCDGAAPGDRATVSIALSAAPAGPPVYRIVRSRKRAGGETLEVAGPDGQRGTEQADVDRLIGASYSVFTRTILRGQNDVWNFAEATDSRKREILDAVSGAEMLTQVHEATKKRLADLRAEIRLTEAQAEAASGPAGRDLAPLVASVDGWVAAHRTRVTEAETDVVALEEALTLAQAGEARAAQVAAKRAAIEAAMPVLDLAPFTEAVSAARTDLSAAEATVRGCQKEVDRYSGMNAGTGCPTCGQQIAPDAPLAAQKAVAERALLGAQEGASVALDRLLKAQAADRDATRWLTDQMAVWRSRLERLPAAPTKSSAQVAETLVQAHKRLEAVRAAENPWSAALAEASLTQDGSHRRMVAAREQVALLRQDEAWLEALVEAYGPKGARAALGRGALAAIDTAANRWLNHLSGGKLAVEFDPERTTKAGTTRTEVVTTVKMQTPNGQVERDLLQLSGGQRVRVNFAVDLGVAACFSRGGALALSLLVLDEAVFSNLDDAGKFAMVQAIHQAGVADVVVIDHDLKISDAFERTIKVAVGDDGWSTLEDS